MITSISTMITIVMITTMASGSSNPVKIRIVLTILSSGIFLKIKMNGNSWYPILFFLIFIGGILIMFIILSSVLPNEKSEIKKKVMETIILVLLAGMFDMTWEMRSQTGGRKAFLQSSNSFFFLTAVIVLYFFLSIKIVSEEEITLRSILCYNNSNLVNYL